MNILITGGTGFIGGRLAVYLHESGHSISLASRNNNIYNAWLPNVPNVKIDWESPSDLASCCKNIDVVIHAAGMNSEECAKNPIKAHEFNGQSTARLANAASANDVKQFIYISSIHVYGNPLTGTITEKQAVNNTHPYATSHVAGELAVLEAVERTQMSGIVLRLSNAFGSPSNVNVKCWSLLINDLCMQAVVNRQLALKTNGKSFRDFISIDNVCSIIKQFIDIHSHTKLSEIINIGSGNSTSILSMANLIQMRCKNILGYTPNLVTNESPDDLQTQEFNYCINKLNSLIPIEHRINDIHGVDRLLYFCKKSFYNKN